MHVGTPTNQAEASVLDLLAIPSIAGLSEHQVRGMACVWDGITLTSATAVDLGVQSASRAGEPVSWYPRACRGCVALQAHRGLLTHGATCTMCAAEATAPACEIGRGLYRLVREYRR
jgi:hypothetical protein